MAKQRASSWPPTPRRLAIDGARSAGELGAMGAVMPLLRRAPKGDGHPVLVLPGLGGGDRSTTPMRWFLRDRGYFVHGWRLGRNLGPNAKTIQGMRDRVKQLSEEHEGQAISLVGWSMGGIFAREIARATPQVIRQVITLGSPFSMVGRGLALQVPTSAIYTRNDGVVDWRNCMETPGTRRENIEVKGSHTGLGHNPAVLLAVADRLAQPKGSWAPFVPTSRWRRVGGVSEEAG